MFKQSLGWLFFALFLLTVPLSNYAILHWGTLCSHKICVVPVWPKPKIYAASGVVFAGLTFVLRDLVQRALGLKFSILAVLLGATISYGIASPQLATASFITFLIAETIDTLVYTPLQQKNFIFAVIISSIASSIIDSALFLFLAFNDLTYLLGMVIGKILSVVIATLLVIWLKAKTKF